MGSVGRRRLIAASVAAVAAPAIAQVDSWPARPIRVIVPYPAGGTSDLLIRLVAGPLGARFGQQFIVDNRGGAGGVTGTRAIAAARPDGYTLGVSGIPTHVIAPIMNREADFDPLRDFAHIAFLGGPPNVWVVHPSLGVTDFPGLLALARAEREPLRYVSSGIGTIGNLAAEYLARKERFALEHVAYRGGNPAMADLGAGHVMVGSMAWITARAFVGNGTVRALAQSGEERMAELPAVPTLRELGHPELVTTTWFSLSAPAGTPPEIVSALNRAVIEAQALPEVRRQIEAESVQVRPMTPAELTAFMHDEIAKWGPIARMAGTQG